MHEVCDVIDFDNEVNDVIDFDNVVCDVIDFDNAVSDATHIFSVHYFSFDSFGKISCGINSISFNLSDSASQL